MIHTLIKQDDRYICDKVFTRRSLISSCPFSLSKKDEKKSLRSTCRGATHKASISAPGEKKRHFDTQRVHFAPWTKQIEDKNGVPNL